ncbi:MAG: hypothetical protein AAGC60_18730 [Acidobacteriota bacterium]
MAARWGAPVVFFRDDDVTRMVPQLRVLVDLFLEVGVPCNFQVIPTMLTAEAADWLCARHARAPALLHFNQHGSSHERYGDDAMPFGEFGLGRSLEEQRALIRDGQERLRRALGEAFSPAVFSPPWHRYDATTVQALELEGVSLLTARLRTGAMARAFYRVGRALRAVELGGHVVSHHGHPIARTRVLELSPSIDVDEDFDRNGRRALHSADALRRAIYSQARHDRVVGINLHHFKQGGARGEVPSILRRLIMDLRRDGCEFRSLEDLVAELKA